jgi:hypothetical protein
VVTGEAEVPRCVREDKRDAANLGGTFLLVSA